MLESAAVFKMGPVENEFILRIAKARGFSPSEPVLAKACTIVAGNPGGLTVLHMLNEKVKAVGMPESEFERLLDYFSANGLSGEDLWVEYKYKNAEDIDTPYCHFVRLLSSN